MIVFNEMKEIINKIDESLYSYLHLKGKYQQKIYEAIKYSLFTGGKRLRPILAIKTFELFKENTQAVIPFACAIEMIHTYSLIHDDLPAMDDDKIRRGNPTNHIVFGEALAILAGDGLLNLAFETMLKDTIKSAKDFEDYKTRVRIMEIISNCSGVEGMIGGQVVDLLAHDENMDEDKLNFMYSAKTSALFEASVLTGSILGGADEVELEIMHKFAKNIGLAYQIKDDFLDVNEDEAINKYTFLSFNDNGKAVNKLDKLTNDALNELDKLKNRDTEFLRELTIYLLNRKK
ncbi:polyprenyl synthetase family protein [Tissierella creatinophila]|uniref:Farnesyl diphosphate synthase n=1 Tax=Tissierella creatinophila DSM 6911 TaxID=1123403 RepID=A0A1U7M9C5_TISCR|nr:farnesyl diphosphate synthase [Tissierella creatinophila]OLS03944.1 farnesyl diphosphate synthase [Tissierella creatinophila DSM 6911]